MAEAGTAPEARLLTDVITRLRRTLRASIRSDYPFESLPMAQVELLQCLQERDGARVGELATALRLAPNTVSTLVQQLVDAGAVRRRPDPGDRRAARVSLTGHGRRQVRGWQDAHERRLGAALGRLPPEDRSAVLAALPALGRLVDELGDRGPTGR